MARRRRALDIPSQSWSDPGLIWIWLPPADRRPAPLAGFGPGARLGAVVAALDEALPDLREQVRAEQAQSWREGGGLYDDEPVADSVLGHPGGLVDGHGQDGRVGWAARQSS